MNRQVTNWQMLTEHSKRYNQNNSTSMVCTKTLDVWRRCDVLQIYKHDRNAIELLK